MEALFSSKKMDWETPDKLFSELNQEFGFTFDLAASAENKKTPRYTDDLFNLTLDPKDGEGALWMNPPYGREIVRFMAKAYELGQEGYTVVCLVPSRTDTKWWHSYVQGKADEVRFIQGRLKFKGGKTGAPFPSAIVIYRPKPQP